MKIKKKFIIFNKKIKNGHSIERRLLFLQNYPDNKAKDKGSYLLILFLKGRKRIRVGGLGKISFPKGFYIYVGSAMKGLKRRMERHQRLKKTCHWHIDYLRAEARFYAIIPVPSSRRLECKISKPLSRISQWIIPKFGSSDCSCSSHLFGMENDPLKLEGFFKIVEGFRN